MADKSSRQWRFRVVLVSPSDSSSPFQPSRETPMKGTFMTEEDARTAARKLADEFPGVVAQVRARGGKLVTQYGVPPLDDGMR